MVEKGTVRRLLRVIEVRLARSQKLAEVTLAQHQQAPAVQDRVERNFEVCIQACIDLGSHILADFPGPIPESNRAAISSVRAVDQHSSGIQKNKRPVLLEGQAPAMSL